MNKAIFLDFDGVITTLKSNWRLDVKKMELVKHICDMTDAKIVISSSWRRHTLEDTIEFITTKQIEKGSQSFLYPEYVIGITDRMYAFKHGNREIHYGLCRGAEIEQWIIEHKDVTKYVIIDDDSDMLLYQKNHFIQTDTELGISKHDAERAIKILNS